MAAQDKLSDQELMELVRSGNHAAFTVLYDRYWDKLLAIAYNHTRDQSSAKEIVQNLFIGLWNRLVFKLSREQHKSNTEIAEEIGISEKTVEMHITKALKTIRSELKGSGVLLFIAADISRHWLK